MADLLTTLIVLTILTLIASVVYMRKLRTESYLLMFVEEVQQELLKVGYGHTLTFLQVNAVARNVALLPDYKDCDLIKEMITSAIFTSNIQHKTSDTVVQLYMERTNHVERV